MRQLVRLCTDCLSANQIAEFFPYFNQDTIIGKFSVISNNHKLRAKFHSDTLRFMYDMRLMPFF